MDPQLENLLQSVVMGVKGSYKQFKMRMSQLKGGCSAKQFVMYLCSQSSLLQTEPEALVDLGYFISESAWILKDVSIFDNDVEAANGRFNPQHFVQVLKQAAQFNPGAQCALIYILKSIKLINNHCVLPFDLNKDFDTVRSCLANAKAYSDSKDEAQDYFRFCDALIYTTRLAGPLDLEKACELLQTIKLASAQCMLGRYYKSGKGVKSNKDLSDHQYKNAAQQLHPHGLFNVAWRWYIKPNAVDRLKLPNKKEKAIKTLIFENFQAAAAQGYSESQYYLARCYETGQGIKKCNKKALENYLQAAKQNLSQALYALGKIYEKGSCGVVIDLVKAIEYYQAAEKSADCSSAAKGALLLLSVEQEFLSLPDNIKAILVEQDLYGDQALDDMLQSVKMFEDEYPDEALYQYDKILKLYPDSYDAYLYRAQLRLTQSDPRQHKEMLKDLSKAGELVDYDRQEDFKDACTEIFERIETESINIKSSTLSDLYTFLITYKFDPEFDDETFYNHILVRANLYYKQGRYKEAIEDYTIYISGYDANDGEIYRYRGNAYKADNQLQHAKRDYDEASRMSKEKKKSRKKPKNYKDKIISTASDESLAKISVSHATSDQALLFDDAPTQSDYSEDDDAAEEFVDCLETPPNVLKDIKPVADIGQLLPPRVPPTTNKILESKCDPLSYIQDNLGEFCHVAAREGVQKDHPIYIVLLNPIEDIVKILHSYVNKPQQEYQWVLENRTDLKNSIINNIAKKLSHCYGETAVQVSLQTILIDLSKKQVLDPQKTCPVNKDELKQLILNSLPCYQNYLTVLREKEAANLRKQEFNKLLLRLGKLQSMKAKCLSYEINLRQACTTIRSFLNQHSGFLASVDSLIAATSNKKLLKSLHRIKDIVKSLIDFENKVENELKITFSCLAEDQPDIMALNKADISVESLLIMCAHVNKIDLKYQSISNLHELSKKPSHAAMTNLLAREISQYKRGEQSVRALQQKSQQVNVPVAAGLSVSNEEYNEEEGNNSTAELDMPLKKDANSPFKQVSVSEVVKQYNKEQQEEQEATPEKEHKTTSKDKVVDDKGKVDNRDETVVNKTNDSKLLASVNPQFSTAANPLQSEKRAVKEKETKQHQLEATSVKKSKEQKPLLLHKDAQSKQKPDVAALQSVKVSRSSRRRAAQKNKAMEHNEDKIIKRDAVPSAPSHILLHNQNTVVLNPPLAVHESPPKPNNAVVIPPASTQVLLPTHSRAAVRVSNPNQNNNVAIPPAPSREYLPAQNSSTVFPPAPPSADLQRPNISEDIRPTSSNFSLPVINTAREFTPKPFSSAAPPLFNGNIASPSPKRPVANQNCGEVVSSSSFKPLPIQLHNSVVPPAAAYVSTSVDAPLAENRRSAFNGASAKKNHASNAAGFDPKRSPSEQLSRSTIFHPAAIPSLPKAPSSATTRNSPSENEDLAEDLFKAINQTIDDHNNEEESEMGYGSDENLYNHKPS